jgi:hypothetical protein
MLGSHHQDHLYCNRDFLECCFIHFKNKISKQDNNLDEKKEMLNYSKLHSKNAFFYPDAPDEYKADTCAAVRAPW